MKDVPTVLPDGLVIDGMLPRADPRDALVALAMGAGRPTTLDIPNGLARGVRTASDFLMALQLTGAAPYTLSILYPDGTTATLQTGAGALVLITNPILLAPDERLHLLTVGAAAAMYARVTARPST